MDGLLRLCGLGGLAVVVAVLIRGRIALKQTTLTTASSWGIFSVLVWAACWAAGGMLETMNEGLADRLWYATAVLILCPAMSVLGARQPTTRVWQWFVVLPMIAVLALPLAASSGELGDLARLRLETPVLVGFGLILVMSAGNYVGTRFTLSAVLLMVAVAMLVATVAAAVPDRITQAYRLRLWATALLSAAGLIACRRAKTASGQVSASAFQHRIEGADRLWTDFRNAFGIVWARRLQDRINAVAAKEDWPAQLSSRGFVWRDVSVSPGGGSPSGECVEVQQVARRIEHTLRWLLRRFCEPQWIDERLRSTLGVPVEKEASEAAPQTD